MIGSWANREIWVGGGYCVYSFDTILERMNRRLFLPDLFATDVTTFIKWTHINTRPHRLMFMPEL